MNVQCLTWMNVYEQPGVWVSVPLTVQFQRQQQQHVLTQLVTNWGRSKIYSQSDAWVRIKLSVQFEQQQQQHVVN